MMRRLNLSKRFALVIFSVGLILVVPLIGLQTLSARRALEDRAQASGELILDALESLCRAHLAAGDIAGLRRELASLMTLDHMAYVDVLSADGTPWITLSHQSHPRGTSRERYVRDVRDDVLDLSKSLGAAERPEGRLDVGIWVRGVDRDAAKIAQNGLWMGLGLCLCLAVISWALGNRLARRLTRFAGDLAARAPHDFRHFDVHGQDELSTLARAINERHDRLQEAQQQRSRAERERQEVIQMIIHDLKGPLAGFAAGLTLLEESVEASGDASQIQMLQLLERATERLLRMTNSILELGRLEEQTQAIHHSPVDLETLTARRVEEAQLLAKDLGIRLEGPVRSEPPLFVSGDAELLGRVIDNLIFNALEHTPYGSLVSVCTRRESEEAYLEVRDSGPGVPPEERNTIFEKFRKGNQPSRGIGLGLAFCKLAVARHDGRIGVEPNPSGGAIFYVALPLSLPVSAPAHHIIAV